MVISLIKWKIRVLDKIFCLDFDIKCYIVIYIKKFFCNYFVKDCWFVDKYVMVLSCVLFSGMYFWVFFFGKNFGLNIVNIFEYIIIGNIIVGIVV